MKYVLAGLAVVAAVAALFFRPPAERAPTASAQAGSPEAAKFALAGSGPQRVRPAGAWTPLPSRVLVYVAGEVAKPGVYAFGAGARAGDALARAGGAKPDADLVAVNLAAPLADGEEIAVPKIGAQPLGRRRAAGPRARASHSPRRHRHRGTDAGTDAADTVDTAPRDTVDLNSADEAELETVPGIGPALAARIVAYRDVNGRFTSVDELADISGISASLQDKVAAYIVVR